MEIEKKGPYLWNISVFKMSNFFLPPFNYVPFLFFLFSISHSFLYYATNHNFICFYSDSGSKRILVVAIIAYLFIDSHFLTHKIIIRNFSLTKFNCVWTNILMLHALQKWSIIQFLFFSLSSMWLNLLLLLLLFDYQFKIYLLLRLYTISNSYRLFLCDFFLILFLVSSCFIGINTIFDSLGQLFLDSKYACVFVCINFSSQPFESCILQQLSINKQFEKVSFKKNCPWKIVIINLEKKLRDRNKVRVKTADEQRKTNVC